MPEEKRKSGWLTQRIDARGLAGRSSHLSGGKREYTLRLRADTGSIDIAEE